MRLALTGHTSPQPVSADPQHPAYQAQLARFYEEATQPELRAWVENNPQRAGQLTPQEWDRNATLSRERAVHSRRRELPHFVDQIERRRRLTEKLR